MTTQPGRVRSPGLPESEHPMSTYEPADVARAVTIEARGYRIDEAIIAEAVRKMGVLLVDPASTVVLDPNDVQTCARLKYALPVGAVSVSDVQDALRSLLPAVTPPEPNGLGAVVRGTTADGSGATWVRAIRDGGPAKWALSIPDPAGRERWWLWSAMRVTEVLSHGVGCTCGAPDCNGGGQ